LQILGTLDKPSPENEIMLRNDQDILTMNDKNLSKFRNINLGLSSSFTNSYRVYGSRKCIPAFMRINLSMNRNRGEKIIGLSWAFPQVNHKPNELSGGEQQRVAVARPNKQTRNHFCR
jgi:lipoprotein-releasing system ATP-binding protein